MTFRARLTSALLGLVMGPVLLGAVFVGTTTNAVTSRGLFTVLVAVVLGAALAAVGAAWVLARSISARSTRSPRRPTALPEAIWTPGYRSGMTTRSATSVPRSTG